MKNVTKPIEGSPYLWSAELRYCSQLDDSFKVRYSDFTDFIRALWRGACSEISSLDLSNISLNDTLDLLRKSFFVPVFFCLFFGRAFVFF